MERFGQDLLEKAGMEAALAACVARNLVLTDAMGRRTHGLAMAALYLTELAEGRMAKSGRPDVLRDNGHVALWDGRYLPGHYLMEQALALAMPRARQFGLAAVAIRRNHHIGALALWAKVAADEGLLAFVANSDPASSRAAPFGGTEAVFTPNPIGFGYPTGTTPVLVDISATITSTSMTRQKAAAGELFEHAWLLDSDGRPTRDPQVLENRTPRGSLQLVGGVDHGHKGYGLTLMVEALSQGLSGEGRKKGSKVWGGNTYLQVIDPELFAGRAVFESEMSHLSDLCRNNRPVDPARPVRLPGDAAVQGIERSRTEGLRYSPAAWDKLSTWAHKLGVALPPAL